MMKNALKMKKRKCVPKNNGDLIKNKMTKINLPRITLDFNIRK